MKVPIELVKQLREETQASVAEVNSALQKSNGNIERARKILQQKGFEAAAKKGARATKQGLIEAYVHGNGKIGVLMELLCETDFVARTNEFKTLAHEIAMQVAAMNPANVEALLQQEYIRDSSKTIELLLKEAIAKLGENVTLKRFKRFEIGKEE